MCGNPVEFSLWHHLHINIKFDVWVSEVDGLASLQHHVYGDGAPGGAGLQSGHVHA